MTEGRQSDAREPRRFEVVSCYDCGYVGNRVDGDEKDEIVYCVDCGEAVGAWFVVQEVIEDA